jgi:D,D-heptose 1,7-bisphosphate phosphatase
MQLTVGAVEGLRALHAAGYKLIIISNQSGVARGYFPEEALLAVQERSRQMLAEMSVPLTGFYYCPHHPDGSVPGYNINCSCRKPEPGLILRAAREHDIDLAGSWFIGDILNDVEAGHRAGCKTVLIDNGNETEWVISPMRTPHYIASDLSEAASTILSQKSKVKSQKSKPQRGVLPVPEPLPAPITVISH